MTEIGRGPGVGPTVQTSELDDAAVTRAKLAAAADVGAWMGGATTVPVSATEYAHPNGASSGAVSMARRMMIPRAGQFRNLRIAINAATPVGETVVVTVRVDDVNTALTATIPASSAAGTEISDLVNVVAVAAGAYVSIEVVSALTGAGNIVTWAFEFTNDGTN